MSDPSFLGLTTKFIAFVLVFALLPLLRRQQQKNHELAKKNMKDGRLKWLVTREFCKRKPSGS